MHDVCCSRVNSWTRLYQQCKFMLFRYFVFAVISCIHNLCGPPSCVCCQSHAANSKGTLQAGCYKVSDRCQNECGHTCLNQVFDLPLSSSRLPHNLTEALHQSASECTAAQPCSSVAQHVPQQHHVRDLDALGINAKHQLPLKAIRESISSCQTCQARHVSM